MRVCEPDSCLNDGTCLAGVDDVACVCGAGFVGYRCQVPRTAAGGGTGGGATEERGGLSTGAIVGIAIGAVVGGVLLALALVLTFRYIRRRNDISYQKQIQQKSAEDMRNQYQLSSM